MEIDYLLWGSSVPGYHLPHLAQAAFQLGELMRGGFVGILIYQSVSASLHLANLLPLRALRLNTFSHP